MPPKKKAITLANPRYHSDKETVILFFKDKFIRDPAAAPLTAKEVAGAWRDWKRANRSLEIIITESKMFERMLPLVGVGSTLNEFFGIRLKDHVSN